MTRLIAAMFGSNAMGLGIVGSSIRGIHTPWIADSAKYDAWDRFMAESEESQPFGLALIKARELVDLSRFKINESDVVLDGRIAEGIGLYQAAGMPAVPSLVLPGGVLRKLPFTSPCPVQLGRLRNEPPRNDGTESIRCR